MPRRTNHLVRRTRRILTALLISVGLFALDAQAQWVKANLPLPYALGYYLDIMFLPGNPQFGWACSLDGYVVRTTDGGQTWRGTSVTRPFLEHIQFLTPSIGYTSGPAGIYKSNDGGASWRDITPLGALNDKGWGCFFINQNEGVYLVGGCERGVQYFYRTIDGGNNWTLFIANEAFSGLSDAIIDRTGTGYAVSSGVLWRTTDFGRTWRVFERTGSKVWTEELAMYGNSFLLPTSGTDCDGQTRGVGSIRFSTNNGRSWTEYQTNANMFGTFLINERTGWAAGDDRSVYYTEDAGRTWVLRNCGIEGDMDDIWFISDTLGWVCGDGLYHTDFSAKERIVQLAPAEPLLTICEGDSVLVSATSGFTSYTWSDGANGEVRFLSSEGEYVLTAYDDRTCMQSKDTIRVAFFGGDRPAITASRLEVCEGDSIDLDLQGAFVRQQWSTGDTTRRIVVRNSGTYSVTTLDSNGCTKTAATISVIVHPTPQPEITANRSTTICLDETVTLSAPAGYRSYQWSNGSTDPSITVGAAGVYTVTVTDEFGCIGTSAGTTVVVLNTRNKVGVEITSADNAIVVPEHPVGQMACTDVRITNRSETEDLVIREPALLGNVFCSVPQHQFPIVIPPLEQRTLQVCCAAIDSGLVRDTLVIPDTCSPTIVGVRSRGTTILYNGSSRCDVPTQTIVYRAGTAHHLSAPYPMPADAAFELQIAPMAPARGILIDALGGIAATAEIWEGADHGTLRFATQTLPPGRYLVVVELDGAGVRSFPVSVVR